MMNAQSPLPPNRIRDVQVASLGNDTLVLRSRTWDRLKFEVEYARQRGTTANSYLIQATESALIDPPGESFTDLFLDELQLHQYYQRLSYVILGHVNPNRVTTLKRLLELAPYATVVCSKPGAIALQSLLSDQPTSAATAYPEEALELGIAYAGDRTLKLRIVRDGDQLDLGNGHELLFFFVPTPRFPDGLVTFDPSTQVIFTDKLFGAHVCGEAVFDEHWKELQADRRYYFDCLHAAQATQVETALGKLATVKAKLYAPGHGPIVRHSLSRLTLDYQQWCAEQQTQDFSVALLYASAYGNTATMAQAIARGITQSGAAVKAINCEFADPAEIEQAIETCDGFVIGSPTLGGHAPVQIQTALGVILATAAKTKVAGVFGSYGWSGEAVDMLESKLQDAGYRLGFETLRVKFKPTEAVLKQCETAGSEFIYTLKKARKSVAPRQFVAETQTDRTGQAVGRVTGSLCVVTTKKAGKNLGIVTSWVSQATFNPPGITVAIAQHGNIEFLATPGEQFVLNILKDGSSLRRHFQRTFLPNEDAFTDLDTELAPNGNLILIEALSWLECTVQNRMECGDHWLVYATVNNGRVLDLSGVTAVNHRKSGNQY